MRKICLYENQASAIGQDITTPYIGMLKGNYVDRLYVSKEDGDEFTIMDDNKGFITVMFNDEIFYVSTDGNTGCVRSGNWFKDANDSALTIDDSTYGVIKLNGKVTTLADTAIPMGKSMTGETTCYRPFVTYQVSGMVSVISESTTLKEITLPNTITKIGTCFFFRCTKMEKITLPKSLVEIGNMSFAGCGLLKEINFPEGLTTIGAACFSACSGLTSLSLPDTVETIEASAFINCSGMTEVKISSGVKSIGNSAFQNCHPDKYIYNGIEYTDTDVLSTALTDNGVTLGTNVFYSN